MNFNYRRDLRSNNVGRFEPEAVDCSSVDMNFCDRIEGFAEEERQTRREELTMVRA
jgi:hypothetical protein